MTQAERILALLRDRGPEGASNFELMLISYQYPARIHTLRHKHGHVIESKHVKDQEWRITLIKDAGGVMPDNVQTTLVQAEKSVKRVVMTPGSY